MGHCSLQWLIAINDQATIAQTFFLACERYASNSLLAVPTNLSRDYCSAGREWTYAQAGAQVRKLMAQYEAAGYGLGHRVGLLLENRPEHMLHKMALNALGACCVPMNADYRPRETAYLIDHAKIDLLVVLKHRMQVVHEALGLTQQKPQLAVFDELDSKPMPPADRATTSGQLHGDTPASILYTSGTTEATQRMHSFQYL